MNIVVCVKQVIDPEAPPSSFKIDAANNTAEMHGASPVIDPYGEYAVEAAMQIKDAGGGKITVISLGTNLLREVVKKPLAMGADELILLEDEGIAEILGLPCVTLARKIEVTDIAVKVGRVTSDGYDVIEVPLPAVITVSNEVGEPRYPTIKGIMAAKKIDPVIWNPADIGIESAQVGEAGRRAKVQQLYQPVHEGKCEFAEGDSPEEAADNLAQKLREAKIL